MTTKGKITYKQFLTKFNSTEEAERIELCKSHIVNKYVDYQTKLTEVRTIAELGNYVVMPSFEENGEAKRVFKRNTPSMYYLLKIRLLDNYTDINLKDGEELTIYNALEEVGALDCLLSSIPELEISKWNTMLQMVNDDIYSNERDITSYLETKIDAVGMVMDTMLAGLGEMVQKLELSQNED